MIAYTQVKTEDRKFYEELASFEVYGGRATDSTFYNLHYERWHNFSENALKKDELNIFECAFMQNHINELLFWRNADEETITEHLNKLIISVKDLKTVLIYLSQPDICETIQRIARERVSANGDNWIDRCIAYCENSLFGKRHGIMGFEGAMEFFKIRKQLEIKALERLSVEYTVIENPDYDWDKVWTKINDYLQTIADLKEE